MHLNPFVWLLKAHIRCFCPWSCSLSLLYFLVIFHCGAKRLPFPQLIINIDLEICFFGKSTISMAMFNSKLLVYQRVYPLQIYIYI